MSMLGSRGRDAIPKAPTPRVLFTGRKYFLRIADGERGPWFGPYQSGDTWLAWNDFGPLDDTRHAIAMELLALAASHADLHSR